MLDRTALSTPRSAFDAPLVDDRSVRTSVRSPRVALIGLTVLLLSTPQLVNVLKLLPVLLPLLVLAGHVLAPRPADLARTRLPLVAVALVGWLLLTSFWSDDVRITVVQTMATTLVCLIGALIGSHVTRTELLLGVVWGGLTILALSLIVAVVDPVSGLMPAGYQGGALRGLYVHRNLLAGALLPAVVAALTARFTGSFAQIRRVGTVVALITGILLTRSSTALAAVAAAVVLAGIVAAVRRTPRMLRVTSFVMALGMLCGAVALLLLNPAIAFRLLQRENTLTGRAPIWAAVEELIGSRPLQGYGWGATWEVGEPVRTFVDRYAGFAVPSAHNGYLDAWLQAGLIGLVLFLLLVAQVLGKGIPGAITDPVEGGAWNLTFAVSLLVLSVGEAALISTLSIFLLVVTVTNVHRPSRVDLARR